jgi:tetratricopeptide (TPR) repeat protein
MYFNEGQFSRAYGCNRMAAYLYGHGRDRERAVEHLIFCLSNLRPLAHALLIKNVALLLAKWFKRQRLPRNLKAQYLDQLANICFDNGKFHKGRAIFNKAAGLYGIYFRENPDVVTSRDTKIKEGLGRRKLAHLQGVEQPNEGLAMLRDDERLFADLRDNEGRGSTILSIACLLRDAGRTREAIDVLKENQRYISMSSFWNRVEADATLGDLMKQKGLRSANNKLISALKSYKEKRIKPWSMPTTSGVLWSRPDKALGLDSPFVKEYGTISTREYSFPFTSSGLKDCVAAVDS